MDRRGFLGSILVACVAPAIVRADSLMQIVPVETTLYVVQWGPNCVATNVPGWYLRRQSSIEVRYGAYPTDGSIWLPTLRELPAEDRYEGFGISLRPARAIITS